MGDISKVREIFNEYWVLTKEIYTDINDVDEWWELIIRKIDDFYEKHEKTKYVKELCVALTALMEERYKELFGGDKHV